MLIPFFLILFYLLTPVLLIYVAHISKTANKIGAVVMAYAVGLIVGNVGIFPKASEAFRELLGSKVALPQAEMVKYLAEAKVANSDLTVNQVASVQDIIMSLAIPIALPLLLFSLDIKRWIKFAKEAFLSLALGVVSLVIVLVAGFFLFRDHIADSWKIAGMLSGVYTGGTPNLVAMATALEVNPNILVLTNTYDMVLGSICLLFLLTAAQKTFNLVLPHFNDSHEKFMLKKVIKENDGVDNYLGMMTKKGIIQLAKALSLSVLILAVSFGISLLFPKSSQTVIIILSITTLGLALGLIKSVASIEKTFQLGMYFIIVFCLVVSSMADLGNMFKIDFLHLFLYVALVVFGSMIVHVFLSWIFKVDSDTTIVTITALTYSPPFVPVVAAALKNKDVIITGITSGILGYAFGNYLGIALAYFLKGFL